MFGEAFDMNLNTKTQYTIRRIPRIAAGFFAMLTAAAAVLPCFACSTYAQSQQIRFDAQTAQSHMHTVGKQSSSYFTLSAASGASSAVGVNVFSAASVQPTADVPENQPSENKKPYVGFEEHVRTSGCYVVCPVFVCRNSVLVNAAVKTAFVEYAREQPADRYITYDVMYNDNDLLSIKMCVYVPFEQLNADYDVPTVNGYAVFETRPINIDILSGRILSVDGCFGAAFSDDFAADFGKKHTKPQFRILVILSFVCLNRFIRIACSCSMTAEFCSAIENMNLSPIRQSNRRFISRQNGSSSRAQGPIRSSEGFCSMKQTGSPRRVTAMNLLINV